MKQAPVCLEKQEQVLHRQSVANCIQTVSIELYIQAENKLYIDSQQTAYRQQQAV